MSKSEGPPRSRWTSRLLSPVCSLLLLASFFLYFGLLLGAVFELFRQVDRVLTRSWSGPTAFLQAAGIALLAWLAVRVAWRLAQSIIGLLTRKFDSWPVQRTLPAPPELALQKMVHDVCAQVGSPQPDEIRLSAEDECFVVEERDFGFRTHRRLILVLGLPQLLIMTVGEIQVILAHELAHFRSGDTRLTVFLYRLAESARISAEDLGRRRWKWIDPVYWYFALFQRLFVWVSAPWRRNHELQADEVSAAAYGGHHAAATLLKEWLVECQFDAAVESYAAEHAEGELVYDHFTRLWTEYSAGTHTYLEKRLIESERRSWLDPQPTIGERLAHMRRFPERIPIDDSPAAGLLAPQLDSLCRSLAALSRRIPAAQASP